MSTTHGAGTLANLTKNTYSGGEKDNKSSDIATEKYKKLKKRLKKDK